MATLSRADGIYPCTPPRHSCCHPCLQNLDYSLVECQALVLAPTRELAQQIEKVMRALGDYLSVKCHACVGGTSVREDTRILQVGASCFSLAGFWVVGAGRLDGCWGAMDFMGAVALALPHARQMRVTRAPPCLTPKTEHPLSGPVCAPPAPPPAGHTATS